jgi:protein involved in polysaccharide export with SLBB domain
MSRPAPQPDPVFPAARLAAALAVLACCLAGGCASMTNPVADGVPVRRLPDEVFVKPREELQNIPFTLLRQKEPDAYRLAPGDVLGIVAEGILGERNQAPPVRLGEVGTQAPAIGYPVVVQEDGTILLPLLPPIKVQGMTLLEARDAIRKAATQPEQILKPEARLSVSLMQPRKYHVLVIRQDAGGITSEAGYFIGASRRGAGYSLELQAYKNDVLNALALTGGLPGLEATNEVIVLRGNPDPAQVAMGLACSPPKCATGYYGNGGAGIAGAGADGSSIVRIPLRIRPGDQLPFRPEDTILQNGDIVFIESRETEVYYTAGLIPVGEYPLPRDYDLDVVEAVARVRGPLVNGGFNQFNQFVQSLVPGGIGAPSPSLVTILRKTSCNRQVPIRCDLNRALRDPRERVIIKPGDILVLQEKPAEALVRYFTTVFRFNWLNVPVRNDRNTVTNTLNLP